jgi:FkbM family methyltransferase
MLGTGPGAPSGRSGIGGVMTALVKFITRRTKRPLKRWVKSIFKHHVYVPRRGLAKGFKVTGDLGFLRKPACTREDRFFMGLGLAGKTVYDIGSHIGIITLFLSRAVGETGQVISFEPNPESFAILCKNVRMNDLNNVRLVNLGLGDKRNTLSLVYGEHDAGMGTLDEAWQVKLIETRRGVRWKAALVDVYPLDEYIWTESLPDPDFVKIDVEGYEYNVLLGMQDTIRRCKPALLVELHGMGNEQGRENARKVVRLLVSHGYRVQEMISGQAVSESHIEPVLEPPFTLLGEQ